MELTYNRVNIVPFVQARQLPTDAFHIDQKDAWWYPSSPIVPDAPTEWVRATGEAVRIPMIPYRTRSSPELAMGHAVQIGAQAMIELSSIIQPKGWVSRLHISIGAPIEDIPEAGLIRYYLGLACVVKGKA